MLDSHAIKRFAVRYGKGARETFGVAPQLLDLSGRERSRHGDGFPGHLNNDAPTHRAIGDHERPNQDSLALAAGTSFAMWAGKPAIRLCFHCGTSHCPRAQALELGAVSISNATVFIRGHVQPHSAWEN